MCCIEDSTVNRYLSKILMFVSKTEILEEVSLFPRDIIDMIQLQDKILKNLNVVVLARGCPYIKNIHNNASC